jgi:hypothetical protein
VGPTSRNLLLNARGGLRKVESQWVCRRGVAERRPAPISMQIAPHSLRRRNFAGQLSSAPVRALVGVFAMRWKRREYLTADFAIGVILSGDIDVPFTAGKRLSLIRG